MNPLKPKAPGDDVVAVAAPETKLSFNVPSGTSSMKFPRGGNVKFTYIAGGNGMAGPTAAYISFPGGARKDLRPGAQEITVVADAIVHFEGSSARGGIWGCHYPKGEWPGAFFFFSRETPQSSFYVFPHKGNVRLTYTPGAPRPTWVYIHHHHGFEELVSEGTSTYSVDAGEKIEAWGAGASCTIEFSYETHESAWSVDTQNSSNRTVIARDAKTVYGKGDVAVLAVNGVGSISLLGLGAIQESPPRYGVRVTSGDYSGLWHYDGFGQCVVEVKQDLTFTLKESGQPVLGGPIGKPLLHVINVPAGMMVNVNAFADTAHPQRLGLIVNKGTTVTQWQGRGPGNMPIADNARIVAPGEPGTKVQVAISVDYSVDGSAWKDSKVHRPSRGSSGTFNHDIFTAQDTESSGENDLSAILSWWEPK